MKTLKIGIMSYKDMKAYSMAVARGERKPRPGEPKIWFTSMQSFARVLSEQNRELLALIAEEKPESLQELEDLTGRKVSNLSRTLKKMEDYGIITLERGRQGRVKPRFPYSGFQLELPIPVMAKENSKSARAS